MKRNVGHVDWWSSIKDRGTPLVQCLGDMCNVIFLWRDPEGNEEVSSTHTVYVEVNCFTDHHQTEPQQLSRIGGTDVWYWEALIPSDWHGTYFFIPVTFDNVVTTNLPQNSVIAPNNQIGGHNSNHRRCWRQILTFAVADSYNKLSPKYCLWGQNRSLLYLTKVKRHRVWQTWDGSKALQVSHEAKKSGALTHFNWKSDQLQNTRSVWLFETTNSHIELSTNKPLVLLLDGENWAELMPIFSVLQLLTVKHDLIPAIYVFIGNVSATQRPIDLGCNQLFWEAIDDELFNEIEHRIKGRMAPHQRCVIGQSLGGLAAMFVGLTRPDMFNHVICQSGSFWWPTPLLMAQGMSTENTATEYEHAWLTTQVFAKKVANKNANIVMQIGSEEIRLNALNHHLWQSLVTTGHQAALTKYRGGHDQVCWREGLIHGLLNWLGSITELTIETSSSSP